MGNRFFNEFNILFHDPIYKTYKSPGSDHGNVSMDAIIRVGKKPGFLGGFYFFLFFLIFFSSKKIIV